MKLKDKLGLVTGGGRGIGRAISVVLASEGAHVLVGFDRNEDAALATVKGIKDAGWKASAIRVSLTEDYAYSFNVDFLVNNAGISAGRSVSRTTLMDWCATLDVNLTGSFTMMQACLPGMIERGWGRIVNVASVVGMDGRLGPSSYAASKAGLVGLTKAAALELAKKGITVNAIAPGFIENTGLLDQVPDKILDDVLARIPMGRFGTTEEVAQAALYLIAHGDYVTGTVLNVSGGWYT
jgi:NAD(P)-dependent dehydrogenase (short-subunit alcohol dehydrogenase family)